MTARQVLAGSIAGPQVPRGRPVLRPVPLMSDYVPPLRDIRFVLEHVVDVSSLPALEPFSDADPDTVFGLVEEAGRFMAEVMAPLNPVGDKIGSKLVGHGEVVTPPGYKNAYTGPAESARLLYRLAQSVLESLARYATICTVASRRAVPFGR